jgi:hypothetical protein
MVSKASDDLPEPESPVITIRLSRGRSEIDALEVVLAGAADRYSLELAHEDRHLEVEGGADRRVAGAEDPM